MSESQPGKYLPDEAMVSREEAEKSGNSSEDTRLEAGQKSELEGYKESWKQLHIDAFYRRESSIYTRTWMYEDSPASRELLGNHAVLKELVESITPESQALIDDYEQALKTAHRTPYQEREKKEQELFDTLTTNPSIESLISHPRLVNVESKKKVLETIFEVAGKYKALQRALKEFFEAFTPEQAAHIDRNTEDLSNNELTGQLGLRQKYIEMVLSHLGIDNQQIAWAATVASSYSQEELDALRSDTPFDKTALPTKLFGISREGLGHYSESQVTLAAFYLAPDDSTHELISKLYQVVDRAFREDNLQHVPLQYGNSPMELRDHSVRVALLKAVHDGTLKLWDGKVIFEIGGDGAVQSLVSLGAQSLKSANAGHDYMSMNMVQDESGLIHLGNYRNYGEPHTADLICSAQLFDSGSGIGAIADRPNSDDADEYGKEEMALLMSNLLKPSGFMVHDAYPPRELMDAIGIHQVKRLSFNGLRGNNNATIYRAVGEPRIQERRLGNKMIRYNPDTSTWETQVS